MNYLNKGISLLHKILIFLILFLLIFGLLLFFNKSFIANFFLNKQISKIEKSFNVKISYENYYFSRNKFYFSNLLVKKDRITLIKIDSIKININFISLFTRQPFIKDLTIKNITANIYLCSYGKYRFDTIKQELNKHLKNNKLSYFNNIIKFFLNFFFNKLRRLNAINVCLLVYCPSETNILQRVKLDNIILEKNSLKWRGELTNFQQKISIGFFGDITKSNKAFYFNLNFDTTVKEINSLNLYFDKKYFINFTNLSGSFSSSEKCLSYVNLNIKNLCLINKYVSLQKFCLKQISFNLKYNFKNDYLIFLKGSKIKINNLVFPFYCKVNYNNGIILDLVVESKNFNSQDLFYSLPKEVFSNLFGIKTLGNLSFYMNLSLNTRKIDSLNFFWKLSSNNFRVIEWGNFPINKLREEFYHFIYENNELVDSIFISPNNSNYIVFKDIPSELVGAILTTEDPSFFVHKGFINEAIRESIIENLKYKRIKRGASTITMQLVKNLFLYKYKVIARKIEEIIITWLIENLNLLSKEKIFEIYVNIIEFGPKVYGLKKACEFYFNKKVKDLNLKESIFLAAIIPFPKYFYIIFNDTLKLKDSYEKYFRIILERMYKRGLITEKDYLEYNDLEINLSEKAKNYIKTKRGKNG